MFLYVIYDADHELTTSRVYYIMEPCYGQDNVKLKTIVHLFIWATYYRGSNGSA